MLYYVNVTVLTLSSLQSAAENLKLNWSPLSVSTVDCIPKFGTEWSMRCKQSCGYLFRMRSSFSYPGVPFRNYDILTIATLCFM